MCGFPYRSSHHPCNRPDPLVRVHLNPSYGVVSLFPDGTPFMSRSAPLSDPNSTPWRNDIVHGGGHFSLHILFRRYHRLPKRVALPWQLARADGTKTRY